VLIKPHYVITCWREKNLTECVTEVAEESPEKKEKFLIFEGLSRVIHPLLQEAGTCKFILKL